MDEKHRSPSFLSVKTLPYISHLLCKIDVFGPAAFHMAHRRVLGDQPLRIRLVLCAMVQTGHELGLRQDWTLQHECSWGQKSRLFEEERAKTESDSAKRYFAYDREVERRFRQRLRSAVVLHKPTTMVPS